VSAPRRAAWALAFLAVVAVVLFVYRPVLEAGVDRFIAVHPVPAANEMQMILADHRFTVWVVSRNARALAREPSRFFDAEACYPAEKSLALGEPVITLSLLAVLPYQLSGDPELTYNAAVIALSLIGGLAMCWLVGEWTGSAAAGLAASLLYLFGRARFGEPIHPYVGDMHWALLALLFARRLFVHSRWRDAVALGLVLALQAGTSVYPAFATALVGLPFALWLVARHRLDRERLLRLAPVAAGVVVASGFVAAPYFLLHARGELPQAQQIFVGVPFFLPGGPWFQGWSRYALAVAGLLAWPRAGAGRLPGDPRWALLAGGLLSLMVAFGPGLPLVRSGWSLWEALAALLPPLQSVRTPGAIVLGFDMVLDVLAGFGVAGLLYRLRRFGAVLPALALLLAVGIDAAAYHRRIAYEAYLAEPEPERIAFFEVLKRKGNDGPIFEWPNPPFIAHTADRISLAAYHHRRTSSCFASQLPGERVKPIGIHKWDRDEMLALHRMGFTTLLVHHTPEQWEEHLRVFVAESIMREGVLHMIHTVPTMTAYSIQPGRVLQQPAGDRLPPGIPALAPRGGGAQR